MRELGRTEQTITAVLAKTEPYEAHASLEEAMLGCENFVRQKPTKLDDACKKNNAPDATGPRAPMTSKHVETDVIGCRRPELAGIDPL